MSDRQLRPLDPVGSIRVKLGLLVGVSVVVSAFFVTLAAAGGVPWWLSVPVAVGVALALTQLLATGMTAPLREMTAAARAMARGDYAVRVHTSSTDEVGDLARAFTSMAEQLDGVDRQRRELIATVAHELRTPLAGLRAQLDNMADEVIPTDLDLLGTQVDRLSALVADLLDLSRVEAGLTALAVSRIAVADLVDRARAAVAHTGREVRYEADIRPADLQIEGDPDRLLQLVTNLLANAARHSPVGGRVRIRARRTDTGWMLEVADDGPGIPADQRTAIFERFGTTDAAGGGTGLGLAVSRWVAVLHGGTLAAVDPAAGSAGARLRLELPSAPPLPTPTGAPMAPQVVTPSPAPAPVPAPPAPAGRALLSSSEAPPRPGVLLAAVGVGVIGGVLLPFRDVGLALTLCLLAGGAVVIAAGWRRRDRFSGACGVLCALCALVPTLRAAEWLTVLAVLVTAVLVLAGTTQARTVLDLVLAALVAAFSPITGLPWLGRCIDALRGGAGAAVPVLRTVVVTAAALLVFGALLASGDAVLGSWVEDLLPDLGSGDVVLRIFIGLAVFGLVLIAALLALDPVPFPARRPARLLERRYEWLAPILVIDALYLAFLAAQATAFFGGEDYVRDTTGLTYAEYVHQGFGQLTVATALTLLVIALTMPRVPRRAPLDRRWLRGAVGLLCLLTLSVVASALHRMDLYYDAYGLTVLRLLVIAFEAWLGLLVLLVMVAGLRMRGGWLARAGLLTGAGAFLLMTAANPEGLVARHNLERAAAGEELDAGYLNGLGADAVPAMVAADPPDLACVLPRLDGDDDLLEWNLGRHRARQLLSESGSVSGSDRERRTMCAQALEPSSAASPGKNGFRPAQPSRPQ